MNTPLIVVVGPTASGKSDFAMQIAQQYNGEIICADSRTVYKGMDIGTAKPSKQDQAVVPHHLLDIREPGQSFSAAEFKRLANQAINEIWTRGKLPVMVGGTGLYIDAVIFDFKFGPPADSAQRNKLNKMSILELQQLCEQQGIPLPFNANNRRHLVRAVELGGLLHQPQRLRSNTIIVGIATEKDTLLGRIEKRAQEMLQAGIVEEAKQLAETYGWDNEAMKGNIYRIFRSVIEGAKTTDEALADFVRTDTQLAKRQLTWFKRNQHIVWGTPTELKKVVGDFVARFDTINDAKKV